MTWNTPTASNTVGQRVKKYQTSGTVAREKKKESMIRGLQMCAFLWRFMEPSEGDAGKPSSSFPAGAAVLSVSTAKAFSWIEAAVEVPPHGAKGTIAREEGSRGRSEWRV